MGMKKTTRRQLKSIRRRRLALALAGALAMPAAPALAQTACSDCLPQYGHRGCPNRAAIWPPPSISSDGCPGNQAAEASAHII